MTGSPRITWVVVGVVIGMLVLLVGFFALPDDVQILLIIPFVALTGGLIWAATGTETTSGSSGRDSADTTDAAWVVAGSVVGLVALLVGLLLLGGEPVTLGLLLPFAVLCGGTLWAIDGVRPAPAVQAVAERPQQLSSVGPSTVFSAPNAPDVPTVQAPTVPEPEGEAVSESVRAAAAARFDLRSHMHDEPADQIQCSNCGRYTHLVQIDDRTVRCQACGTIVPTGASAPVRPDTRVRAYMSDTDDRQPAEALWAVPPVEVDVPTIAVGTSRFQPPTSPRGG